MTGCSSTAGYTCSQGGGPSGSTIVRFKRNAGAGDESQFRFGATATGAPGNYTFVVGITDSGGAHKSASRVVQITAAGQPAATDPPASQPTTKTTSKPTQATSASSSPTASGSTRAGVAPRATTATSITTSTSEDIVPSANGELEVEQKSNDNVSRAALGALLAGLGVAITVTALRRPRRPD